MSRSTKLSAALTSSIVALLIVCAAAGEVRDQRKSAPLGKGSPESVGMSSERLRAVDQAIESAITKKETPGAVLVIGRSGRIVYRKAFGRRAVVPVAESMTEDTIFDLASLTKPVATAASIMILVERGKLSLADTIALHIPEFGRSGKERVTVEQLLTHRSGFPPDNDISDYVGKSINWLEKLYELRPSYEPGTRFVYSDVGYIVAAELVRRVSGKPLEQFTRDEIFEPLGMRDTRFGPLTDLSRVAPTESREGRWMRGEVHDPRAYEMGGVAGHAGLFSTADDLAIFCQMILNEGEYRGRRVLAAYSVERMVSAPSLPASEMRGLGWDVNTGFSSNRGDLFPVGSFGHTGFTGTSIWIDPSTKTFVILLTNRVHPDGKGDVGRLRSAVGSIVAGAITQRDAPLFKNLKTDVEASRSVTEIPRAAIVRTAPAGLLHPVLTGIDVLVRDGFKQLAGRKVGLITNQTGRDRNGRPTIDLLAAAKNFRLVAILSPEHGVRGVEDKQVADSRDEKTGLPVYSLYAAGRYRPTPEMLEGIDTLVFDIQDVGTRYYTYITTCGYAMEEAARRGIKFVVLDRPNPINGYDIDGPVSDADLAGFTAYHSIPVRYGMTIGELALLFNEEKRLGVDLTVIKMEGWRRADYYDGTGLGWVNPSPNMRSLNAALLYPGTGLLETTNLSVGRGTDRPFELVGAPWIRELELSEALNRAGLAGVRFVPTRFTPRASLYANEECGGVSLLITDRSAFRPVATGIEIAYQLHRLYRELWNVDEYLRLLANRAALARLKEGKTGPEIVSGWQAGLAEFAKTRRRYMQY